MNRLLHALALGVVGAGIVHVVVLLTLPDYSIRDAWSRISASAEPYTSIRLDEELLASRASMANPFIEAAACHFDLADGMVHVRSQGHVPFWSMSIYDSNGLNVFSLTDRAARDRVPDFVIASPDQMLQVRRDPPPLSERSVFVEVDVETGVVLVRALTPDETWEGVAHAFLGNLLCEPMRAGEG